MSFPSLAGHAHTLPMGKSIPSHTHTLYDNQGFRLNPLTETDLKEGEVLCDICNGYGYSVHDHWGKMVCKKCNGEGKLDWIERIVGKKNEIQGWSGYTASSGWSGCSGWTTGSSFYISGTGYADTSGYSTGNIVYDTKDNKLKVSDGENLIDVDPLETKKTIGNKILNGFKKLLGV